MIEHHSSLSQSRAYTNSPPLHREYKLQKYPSDISIESEDDGEEQSNASDLEWKPSSSKQRGRTRHPSRSGVNPTSASSSTIAAGERGEYTGTDDGSVEGESPVPASPAFTFIPHNATSSNPPLSLTSLPSYPPDQKPPFSYPVLIRLAILGSPQKRLLLAQIYAAIEEKFPWYRDTAPRAWKVGSSFGLQLH